MGRFTLFLKGSERARNVAAQTLDEVKSAMGITYFKNKTTSVTSEHFSTVH